MMSTFDPAPCVCVCLPGTSTHTSSLHRGATGSANGRGSPTPSHRYDARIAVCPSPRLVLRPIASSLRRGRLRFRMPVAYPSPVYHRCHPSQFCLPNPHSSPSFVFPIDLSQYREISIDPFSTEALSEETLADLQSNVNLCRDAIVFFTACGSASGYGGHTGGAYDTVPEVMLLDAFFRARPDKFVPTFFDEAGHRVATQYLMATLQGHIKAETLVNYRRGHANLVRFYIDVYRGVRRRRGAVGPATPPNLCGSMVCLRASNLGPATRAWVHQLLLCDCGFSGILTSTSQPPPVFDPGSCLTSATTIVIGPSYAGSDPFILFPPSNSLLLVLCTRRLRLVAGPSGAWRHPGHQVQLRTPWTHVAGGQWGGARPPGQVRVLPWIRRVADGRVRVLRTASSPTHPTIAFVPNTRSWE